MRTAIFTCALIVAAIYFVVTGGRRAVATPAADLTQGRYLATGAGQCADCHGPGFHGAPLEFLRPGLPIVYRAPAIAGLPGLSVAQATTFFETGILPSGHRARPPMPQFRLHRDDARALAAYLKSLR